MTAGRDGCLVTRLACYAVVRSCGSWATLAVGIVVLAGCVTPLLEERHNPFIAPADTVLRLTSAVVVTPAVPPEGVLASKEALELIATAIETRLRQAGISVVPSAEYTRVWDGIIRQMGGFFDPLTGERNEKKFAAARRELLRELQGRFDTQVLLYAELQVVDAFVEGGVAEWDGATHDIRGEATPIRPEFETTFERDEFGSRGDGVVSAVTLAVAFDGPDGTEVYRNFGGLEVVARRVVQTEGEFELRAERERVAHAVDLALGPLVARRPAEPIGARPP